MALTLRMRFLLALTRLVLPGSFSAMSVPAARNRLRRLIGRSRRPVPLGGVGERLIPRPDGSPLRARVYTPEGSGPWPLVVYYHGGGFVLGDLDSVDDICRNIARRMPCVVLSIEYRLAPEHRFPAAADDALHAARWALDHAPELAADSARVAVAGDSAGGNLAAVAALRLRGTPGPALAAQVLLYPVTDHCSPPTRSMIENADGFGLTRADMEWFWKNYLPDPASAGHPHAAPLRAPDLSGLPPALILAAEHDPLRDEAEAYARALSAAGNRVRCSRYDGTVHGFVQLHRLLPEGRRGMVEMLDWLRAALAPHSLDGATPR